MSELLPTVQAENIRDSLLDYLTTTFALTDDDARSALAEFLGDPKNGLFKGPYVRLRLPFRPAEPGWRSSLDWYEGFPPYGHQAEAFARLTSADLGPDKSRPLPTLVTTGTGSGKTEAFLNPILDHVLRAKRAGVTGTKAIVLYPMNALANDQAKRLTQLLTSVDALAGVTAALYTGEKGASRTKVTSEGLITERAVIRSDPPDILLTNYKMLDQLLLRHEDAGLWEKSARSLQYLVLDEFHTYDGAQGTDVSMLLRRLGLALKSHWAADAPGLTPEDWTRPLGRITPVATSATLGDKGDPAAMLEFAHTVFGEEFPAGSVITETRLDPLDWIADAPSVVAALGYTPLDLDDEAVIRVTESVAGLGQRAEGRAIAETVLANLYAAPSKGDGSPDLAGVDAATLLDLLKAHPVTPLLLDAAAAAVSVEHLAGALAGEAEPGPGAERAEPERWRECVVALLAAFSHVRSEVGRDAASVDLHLWVRELTRIDRTASGTPRYHWSDDGDLESLDIEEATSTEQGPALPALFCRHCGRSGWGVILAPTGSDLDTDDLTIRRRRFQRDQRFRPLIHAPAEGDWAQMPDAPPVEGLMWFAVRERRLLATLPDDELELRSGRVLPVLTHRGADAGELSLDDACPACQQKNGIRFLGSAIATLLSVTLSTLFGTDGLDEAEKKALVFTDSVQDAAHRAGFVQSRSFSLTLRAVLREAVGDQRVSLDQLVEEVMLNAGDDAHRRYRVVPPELVDRDEFAPFWQQPRLRAVPASVRTRVKRRLRLDAALEFGLQSRTGRTLERTGSVAAEVSVGHATLLRAADQTIEEAGGLPTLEGLESPDARAKTAWVRGVLERMRERGAIEHEWFHRYQQEDGRRYSVWGGRPRSDGMPAFPAGRPAPGYPRVGGKKLEKATDLDAVATPQSWYAMWAAKNLGLSPADGAKLARLLLQRLAQLNVLGVVTSQTAAQIYQLPLSSIVVGPVELSDLQAGGHHLMCQVCQTLVPGSTTVVDQLAGAPCMVARCGGRLERVSRDDNFYRRMYASTDIRRVVAREHTSMLDDAVRLRYEEAFKNHQDNPQAPNVLVATPTLEMGIDIGDLSAVMLASLPRSVASYLQRVGRAGRLTGNALNLAFVTGRGDQLPRLGDPLSVINGQVRPPATYLDAEEILRRQYVASVADRLARDPLAPHPRRAQEAIGSTEPGSYLHALITEAETHADTLVAAFLDGFPTLGEAAREALRTWASPVDGVSGTSPLAVRLHGEAHRWAHAVETLGFRRSAIAAALPELQKVADGPAATDDDKRAVRTARASLRLTLKQLADLRGEYWIGVLEEYGILPNYTLLDDSVTLDVTLSWVDPDSGEYMTEPFSYHRGGSQALREFAPGATFYAGGHRLVIDAIDLGHDGEAVRTWVFCPACGYAADPAVSGSVAACPRCGGKEIADTKQRLEVVELERVYSAMRRDDAVITDDRDERTSEVFTVVTAADIDSERVTRQWFVEGYGFGAKHLRDQTIRWVNIGKAGGQGSSRLLANSEYAAPLFRICASCGQLDTSTGANRRTEHRPWCPHRKSATENTRSIALSRTLRTEGLVMRLPRSVTLGDGFAVPSLSAAILLGLRERIGGAPDHIQVATIVDPTYSDGTENHEALLLHDVVPGGTGYLAELADPETVWSILHTAWTILRDCECQTEQRLACHRCLLPFAAPHQVRSVSRAAAERHLRDILTSGHGDEPADEMDWTCTLTEPRDFDPESDLEQRFRAVLGARLKAAGATIKDQPTSKGNRSTITIGGSGRVWTLEPQQFTQGSVPDFVLRCNQGGIPEVAIFADGWQFHASPAINRLADDAGKRSVLRDSGRIVLGITWQDLEDAEAGVVSAPSWFSPDQTGAIIAEAAGQLTAASVELITGGPVDLLVSWIQDPQPDALERLANWLPLFLLSASQHQGVADLDGSVATAVHVLDGQSPAPAEGVFGWVWKSDTVALAARAVDPTSSAIELALVLDDRPHRVGPEHKAAWRDWLRLSNLLNRRTAPTVISTRTLADLSESSPASGAALSPAASLPAEWQELYDNGTAAEKHLVLALAEAGVDVPVQGEETPDGIPLGLAWPQLHVVVDIGYSDEDRADLSVAHWRVVEPTADAVRDVLTAGRS
ncbi:DEAD/DEAH box helicase [Geodermatophilus sp. SYSU D00758]